MRKAIGLLIILWGMTQFFSTSTLALDSAARETFKAVETAAIVSQVNMQDQLAK